MAKKKFGKFLLFTAAVGAVAAGAYYYFQNKESVAGDDLDEDEDYDDFSEDLDEDSSDQSDSSKRSYVSLNLDKKEGGQEPVSQEDAAKVVSALDEAAKNNEPQVEEFFDEDSDDGSQTDSAVNIDQ